MMLQLESLLTADELARLLKLERRTIMRMARRGELPAAIQIGRQYRWSLRAVAEKLGIAASDFIPIDAA